MSEKNSHFPEINREAAREAVRQIRLRNISGIIIIDFINMKSAEEKKELLAYLQLELKRTNPGNDDDEHAAGGNYTKENPKNTGGKFTWVKKKSKQMQCEF